MSFVGGKLKLKGGEPVKGGVKKKKKKSSTGGGEAAGELALATTAAGDGSGSGGAAATSAAVANTSDGYVLPPPAASADRRTEAQKRHDERLAQLEAERLRKEAAKGYRDRVKDFNEHLASLSEHHDIPKVCCEAWWWLAARFGGAASGVTLSMVVRVAPATNRHAACRHNVFTLRPLQDGPG
jgi:protein FAM32A